MRRTWLPRPPALGRRVAWAEFAVAMAYIVLMYYFLSEYFVAFGPSPPINYRLICGWPCSSETVFIAHTAFIVGWFGWFTWIGLFNPSPAIGRAALLLPLAYGLCKALVAAALGR